MRRGQVAPVDSVIMDAMAQTPTQTIHAVFLDVDGTYADYGLVPEAHARAVRAARSAGNKVLLCTGRPVSMLPPHILEAGFDGLVASAGAYVEVAGEVLMDRRLPAELAAKTLATLDAHEVIYVLESPESLNVRADALPRLRETVEGPAATDGGPAPPRSSDRCRPLPPAWPLPRCRCLSRRSP